MVVHYVVLYVSEYSNLRENRDGRKTLASFFKVYTYEAPRQDSANDVYKVIKRRLLKIFGIIQLEKYNRQTPQVIFPKTTFADHFVNASAQNFSLRSLLVFSLVRLVAIERLVDGRVVVNDFANR